MKIESASALVSSELEIRDIIGSQVIINREMKGHGTLKESYDTFESYSESEDGGICHSVLHKMHF